MTRRGSSRRIAIENVGQRIEWGRVFAQALTFVQGEQGRCSGILRHRRSAGDRALLAAHQLAIHNAPGAPTG